jgi:hypothetical protein
MAYASTKTVAQLRAEYPEEPTGLLEIADAP